jgi:hypothetical protein
MEDKIKLITLFKKVLDINNPNRDFTYKRYENKHSVLIEFKEKPPLSLFATTKTYFKYIDGKPTQILDPKLLELYPKVLDVLREKYRYSSDFVEEHTLNEDKTSYKNKYIQYEKSKVIESTIDKVLPLFTKLFNKPNYFIDYTPQGVAEDKTVLFGRLSFGLISVDLTEEEITELNKIYQQYLLDVDTELLNKRLSEYGK